MFLLLLLFGLRNKSHPQKHNRGTPDMALETGTYVNSLASVGIAAPFVRVTAPGPFGGVLTDGCIDSLTGRPFLLSGTIGAPSFRVG